MFFNFFVFAIIISGVYAILEQLFLSIGITMTSVALLNLKELPVWGQFINILFDIRFCAMVYTCIICIDLTFYGVFIKLHHSVKEMGFAAHLRYHWMENIFYKPLKNIRGYVTWWF